MSNKGYKSERLQTKFTFAIDWSQFDVPPLAFGRMAYASAMGARTAKRADIIRRAKREFLATGHSIKGVRIIVEWRNPDNRNPRHADWKSSEDPDQSLYEVWKTLQRGRGVLG